MTAFLFDDRQRRQLGEHQRFVEAHQPAQYRQALVVRQVHQLADRGQVGRFVLQPIILQQTLDLGGIAGCRPLDLHLVDEVLGARCHFDVVVVFSRLKCVEGLEADLGQLLLGPLANEVVVVAELPDQPIDALVERYGRLVGGAAPRRRPVARRTRPPSANIAR